MPKPDLKALEAEKPQTAEDLQGAPESLVRDSLPRMPYPVSALGPVLSDVAFLLHDVIQAPIEICAQSILAAVSLAVQAHANISLDGGWRQFPPSLFMFTIASTGERKSPVDDECLRPHVNWEFNARAEWQQGKLNHRNKKDAWEQERRRIIAEKGIDDAERQMKLLGIGPEPAPDREPIILVDEPTYEGLVKMYSRSIPTAGLFSDEGGRFLGSYSMSKDNMQKSIAGLSQLWGGKRITRVRASDETLVLYGRRLSMHLLLQPGIVRQILASQVAQEQGFLARILMASPEPKSGTRKYKKVNLNIERCIIQYRGHITEILNEELPYEDATTGDLKPRELVLEPAAEQIMMAYHDDIEINLKPDGKYDPIRGFANKAVEQALRMAACLTLFNDINATVIQKSEFLAGVTLIEYYLHEHRRLALDTHDDPVLDDARAILDWAQANGHTMIYPQLIYQDGPRQFRKKSDAMPAIMTLAEHGYLFQLEKGIKIHGKGRRQAWQLV